MKYKTTLVLISFLLILSKIYAQTAYPLAPENSRDNSKMCSLEKGLSNLYLKYPEKKEDAIQNNLKLLLKVDSVIDYNKNSLSRVPRAVIPVVFHYFYDDCVLPERNETNYTAPLTDDRFIAALERLNNDFKGSTGTTCLLPECGRSTISFKLAEIDPNGNPTTGINRIISGLTYQGLSNEKTLKQKVQWARNQYLNIYVVERATPENNSGLAHYPTTSHNENEEQNNHLYDGPTIARWALDPTNRRADYAYILSHEVGHWLGLRHIWGSPNDGDYTACECSMDDFDFFAKLVDDFGDLFGSNIIPNLNELNDTPNTIGYSIHKGICNTVNTCNGFGANESSCVSDITDDNYDYLQNIMDYTPCGKMFTPGQILFMEAVMRSDIAERSKLVINSDKAFYTNSNQVRLVFSESTTFYESFKNNGSFINSLKMKLEGNDSVTFKNELIGTELAASYFNFNNLPVGLNAQVSILNAREAELIIEGNTNMNADLSATFSFSAGNDDENNNPFNDTLSIQNRSKTIQFDFIEEAGIVHHNLKLANAVGSLAKSYQPFIIKTVNDIAKYYFISSYKNNNNIDVFTLGVKDKEKAPVEVGLNVDGSVKIYTKGQTIDTTNYEYQYYPVDYGTLGVVYNDGDIYYKALDFNFAEEFYVGIKIKTCQQPYFGWLRFKYDSACNSLKAIDYAVKTNHSGFLNAGDLDEPTISFDAPIINNSNSEEGAYQGFKMELLNTANSQLNFNDSISSYFSIEANEVGLTENDISITKLNDSTAYLKPANTVFWQNRHNIEFEFDLKILSGGINGASANFSKATNVEVSLSTIKSEFYEKNKTVPQNNGYWASLVRPNNSEMGLQYYANENNSGYNIYATGGINVEFACELNTNIVTLFDAGDVVNDNLNYRKAQAGKTNNYVLHKDELYIPQTIIDDLAVSTKYMAFKLMSNCKIFYGYVKITLNSDGTVTLNNYYLNLIEDEETYIGVQKPFACVDCIPSIRYLGDDVFYIKQFYINGIAQPLVDELTLNSNHYFDYSIPHKDNAIPLNSVIDLSDKLTHTFKIDLAGDYVQEDSVLYTIADATVWIDFNMNNCFESKEKIYSVINDQSGLSSLSFTYEFPEHLMGNYKIRLYAGLHDFNESGCGEATFGEFEDHTIHFLSACKDKLLYDDTFYFPSGSFGAKDIVVKPTTRSILYTDQESTMYAQNSISIFQNTEIHAGADFLADIKICEEDTLKHANSTLSNTNIKIFLNPFNQKNTVEYKLYNDSEISLFISDFAGKKLIMLNNNEQKATGTHQVIFNDKEIDPGIYYCTLIDGDKMETQKMLITK